MHEKFDNPCFNFGYWIITGLVRMDNNRSDLVQKSNFVNKLKSVQIGKPKPNRPEYLGRVRVSGRLLRQ